MSKHGKTVEILARYIFLSYAKLYKKSEFWRDMAFYITPKLGKIANESFFRPGLSETSSIFVSQ
ncbi:MAG TPA: hypothetical protein VK609_13390 [Mucilaginibacter sp.]|nr:hypothetical protein [Mucilaginibacter sp.]